MTSISGLRVLNRLIPSTDSQFESALTPDEAVRRVGSLIDPLTEPRDKVLELLGRIGRYRGRIRDNQFTLRRILLEYHGGYYPSIKGDITRGDTGCKIHIRFRTWGWVFPLFLAVVVCPLVILKFSLREMATFLCFPPVYHFVGCCVFWFERHRTERDLRILLPPLNRFGDWRSQPFA